MKLTVLTFKMDSLNNEIDLFNDEINKTKLNEINSFCIWVCDKMTMTN